MPHLILYLQSCSSMCLYQDIVRQGKKKKMYIQLFFIEFQGFGTRPMKRERVLKPPVIYRLENF